MPREGEKRRRGKGMRSSTRSIPRIDCSRDAEPDDAGPALRGHPTLVRGIREVNHSTQEETGLAVSPQLHFIYIRLLIIIVCRVCILFSLS